MSFSEASKAKLATCHPDLQRLFEAVSDKEDLVIVCGHRTMIEQELAFRNKRTKFHWPRSKHNAEPSNAVDVAPYPIDWRDTGRFEKLSAVIKETAEELGINVRWGGDWIHFPDLPHWEMP